MTLPNGDVVGTTWAYLNTSKQSIFVDQNDQAGLMSLLVEADAVIESSSPEPLISRVDIANICDWLVLVFHLSGVLVPTLITVRIYLLMRRLVDNSTRTENPHVSLFDGLACTWLTKLVPMVL